MNATKENPTSEDIENIRQSLANISRVENTIRCVSIAIGALGIPRDEELHRSIRDFMYEE